MGKERVHIRRVLRKNIVSGLMALEGMGDAFAAANMGLRLIEPRQQNGQENHVIAEGKLS